MPQMYVKYEGETPVAYAYGEEWISMALYMDDVGYSTPEEAVAAWERSQNAEKKDG